jgi:hypothetical protein
MKVVNSRHDGWRFSCRLARILPARIQPQRELLPDLPEVDLLRLNSVPEAIVVPGAVQYGRNNAGNEVEKVIASTRLAF